MFSRRNLVFSDKVGRSLLCLAELGRRHAIVLAEAVGKVLVRTETALGCNLNNTHVGLLHQQLGGMLHAQLLHVVGELGVLAALGKAGTAGVDYDSMTDAEYLFWSSSENSVGNAVYLRVDATTTGDDYGFYWNYNNKNDPWGKCYVRPVLAF